MGILLVVLFSDYFLEILLLDLLATMLLYQEVSQADKLDNINYQIILFFLAMYPQVKLVVFILILAQQLAIYHLDQSKAVDGYLAMV